MLLMTEPDTQFNLDIPQSLEGMRVDRAIAELLPDYSRATIQQWLKDGHILLHDKRIKPSEKLHGGEQLAVSVPRIQPSEWRAQNIPLEIIYQDSDLLVLNKPAGLVVHPGAGNPEDTLLNGLLYFDAALRLLPRAGIVHRLDKDTSGLMVVARSEMARQHLIEQLKDHSVSRRYLALVTGVPVTGETINQPIGRHRFDRLRMTVTERGKPSITHTRIKQKYRCHALIEANLETGRTHQIRVHLSWRGFPLVGDSLYGARLKLPVGATPALIELLSGFKRQALHATGLTLQHPRSGEMLDWQRDVPADMAQLINALAQDLAAYRETGENEQY